MARKLYITGVEPGSGKSVVALGVMELLSMEIWLSPRVIALMSLWVLWPLRCPTHRRILPACC